MSEFIQIEGGTALRGEVKVSGAKNAVLPMLIASLLTSEPCEFRNVPALKDVSLTARLLNHFGGIVEHHGDYVTVHVPALEATEASYGIVKSMRASFWVLGPLLARGRAARVALPGGDIIGARPVDMHLEALTQMGADIQVKHGTVLATAPDGLKPADISLRFPSVGATHQILLAAALTPGVTTIRGAAREPEVVALADMLCSMGATIEGAGSSEITIDGVDELRGTAVTIIGDRIEAASYILAALASDGDVTVTGFSPAHLGKALQIFEELGANLELLENGVRVRRAGPLKSVRVTTGPFPEFATDMQAPLMALLTLADGVSCIEETIFEGRFGHVSELCRMGARISVQGHEATIRGVPALSGASVEAFDIRGAAAMVIAGVAADGITRLYEPNHIRRGYEALEAKLQRLGANIGTRIENPEDYLLTGC